MVDFLKDLEKRKLIAQTNSEGLLEGHLKKTRVGYTGFDPTASSLHAGHLGPLLNLIRWIKYGHKAIFLLGGATGYVGDPSGKTQMRTLMEKNQIRKNTDAIKKQVKNILKINSISKMVFLDNSKWLSKLNYLDFLRDTSSYFSVNKMLAAECYKTRMESGLSFLEFNYMALQSYDFWYLYKKHNCTIQLGGDDQWSNILAGTDLIRRKEGKKAFAITSPLLLTAAGNKMGKTEEGTIWLNPQLTSPYDFFQYWRNIDDGDVLSCLRKLTFLSVDELGQIENWQGAELNQAKEKLAFEVTAIVHGKEQAQKSLEMTKSLFGQKDGDRDAPIVNIDKKDWEKGISILDIAVKGKLCSSKGEVRRLIEQGGFYVNDKRVESVHATYTKNQIEDSKEMMIRKGKKKYYKIIFS